MSLLSKYRFIRKYFLDAYNSKDSNIKLYNVQIHSLNNYSSLNEEIYKKHWLYNFINSKNYLKNQNEILSIFGVNGDRKVINFNNSKYKIFYTIENVHEEQSTWIKYEDLLINEDEIDLSLGFDYIINEKYLRFPYWIMTNFEPKDDYQTIKTKCDFINSHIIDLNTRSRFCSFISRVDYFGDRLYFYNQISSVGHVDCDGNFLHNNDDLRSRYNDNKREFLKLYKFNLCPENTNFKGYVTEKIFDAIYSGCIPIYWGSENNPEPDILNHSSIYFINRDSDNSAVLKELDELNKNPRLYKLFAEQNRLSKNAPEIIYNYFDRLDKKLKEIVK